jgi:site-specific recombinase XerD
MGKLRDQMLVDLQLSGAKPSTQRAYLREAANLAKYFNRSQEQLGEDELKAYLLHMMKERHLSEGTFRFYVAGLKFLYRTTLKREWAVEKIRYPRAKRKLPVVLDLSEVESLFSVTKNLKHKAILMITYSSGLRVSETARLKLTDIDSKRMMVRISQGKGGKDRYSILSQRALEQLRQYWHRYRPTFGLRDPHTTRKGPETSRCSDRGNRHSAHLGPEPYGSPPHPLYCHRGRALLRQRPLGLMPQRLFHPGPSPVGIVQRKVP